MTIYSDDSSVLSTGNGVNSGTVSVIHHADNIPLNPAVSNNVVLTYTASSPNGHGYEEQLFRHDSSGNGGPFVATATFTPEPAALSLLGLGGVGLLARRRRA